LLAEDDSAELRSVDFEDQTDDVDATAPPPPLLRMPAPSDSPAAMAPQVPHTDPATFSQADISTLQDPEHDEELLVDLATSDVSPLAATPPDTAPSDTAPSDTAPSDTAPPEAAPPEPKPVEAAPLATAPADLAEQLFIQGTDIADAATIEQAARITLDVLDGFVTAQAKSVLYASINDTRLRFLAADGPSAAQVTNMTVPLGHGIAGFCFDTGAALIIRNARRDPRHLADVDQATGFHTGDMMSVALRDHEGGIYGCVQLINPPTRFQHWQLEAAIALATTLGEYIRMRA
ncbi:MAG: GAF domain-containing protein, partial [Oligoflexia bacterium]|nr:GAF domain-containing protein [Oligoflexia bacterium]